MVISRSHINEQISKGGKKMAGKKMGRDWQKKKSIKDPKIDTGFKKSVRKKIVSRAKKKSHGTLEETIMAERQEDFWKSRRIEEEPEESEDVVYESPEVESDNIIDKE